MNVCVYVESYWDDSMGLYRAGGPVKYQIPSGYEEAAMLLVAGLQPTMSGSYSQIRGVGACVCSADCRTFWYWFPPKEQEN